MASKKKVVGFVIMLTVVSIAALAVIGAIKDARRVNSTTQAPFWMDFVISLNHALGGSAYSDTTSGKPKLKWS